MIVENMKKKYIIEKESYYSCQYLIVFCTKYQRKFLSPEIKTFLQNLFQETADTFDFKIYSLEILENQVSLIIDCNPKFGVDKAITKLKNNSSSALKKHYPYLEKKVPSIWTRKSFISTMGNADTEDVNKFILNQKRSQ